MRLFIIIMTLFVIICPLKAETAVAQQYIKEVGNDVAISPTNITTVAAGVDKYTQGFNVMYSEHQSVGIKVDAGSATAFSISVQVYAVDSDGTEYWEDINPVQVFSFTADTEERHPLSLPVGVAFRFKFVADAAAAYEIERLTVYRK